MKDEQDTTYPMWQGTLVGDQTPLSMEKILDAVQRAVCSGNPFLEAYYLLPTPEATIKYLKRYHKRGLRMRG